MKLSNLIRPGHLIEIGCIRRGRPSYRWVQGWQVFDPSTGRWCVEMRRRDAIAMAKQIKVKPT